MKKYETVIFDLDGTLLYTLEDLTKATNYALRRMICRSAHWTMCAGLSETVWRA